MYGKACLLFLLLVFAACPGASADELIIVNNSLGRDVCEFYISAHAETDWGDDILSELDECLHHGNSARGTWNDSWRNTSYDLRVVYRDGSDYVVENYYPKHANDGSTVFNLNK